MGIDGLLLLVTQPRKREGGCLGETPRKNRPAFLWEPGVGPWLRLECQIINNRDSAFKVSGINKLEKVGEKKPTNV